MKRLWVKLQGGPAIVFLLTLLLSLSLNLALVAQDEPPTHIWLPTVAGSKFRYDTARPCAAPGGAAIEIEFVGGVEYEYEYMRHESAILRLARSIGLLKDPVPLMYERLWRVPVRADEEGRFWGLFRRVSQLSMEGVE